MSHAEYMRNWRKARKSQRVKELDWPVNLFNQPLKIEDLLAAEYPTPKMGRFVDPTLKCCCGCGEDHKNRVSGTKRNPYGSGHDVLWFAGQSHKDTWIRAGRP